MRSRSTFETPECAGAPIAHSRYRDTNYAGLRGHAESRGNSELDDSSRERERERDLESRRRRAAAESSSRDKEEKGRREERRGSFALTRGGDQI